MFSFVIVHPSASVYLDQAYIDTISQSIEKEVPIAQNGVLNIAFLPDEELQKLNNSYRWIDSTTDVLSFHYFEDFSGLSEDEVAGEIILSESKILSQSKEYGHTAEKEAYILILHGILHILGFDHETDEEYEEMRKHEEKLRQILDLSTTR